MLQSDIEASLRDARSTIAELERQMVTLRRQKSEESQTTKESRDLRKQLDEMKDRNTALEQQMMEYSNTVQDQTKVHIREKRAWSSYPLRHPKKIYGGSTFTCNLKGTVFFFYCEDQSQSTDPLKCCLGDIQQRWI